MPSHALNLLVIRNFRILINLVDSSSFNPSFAFSYPFKLRASVQGYWIPCAGRTGRTTAMHVRLDALWGTTWPARGGAPARERKGPQVSVWARCAKVVVP